MAHLTLSEYENLMVESDNSKYIDLNAWHLVMGNTDPALCDDVESIEESFLVLYNYIPCAN